MTKRQFLAIMYLLTGVIPLIAQTFTEQKKSYPVSADGNKYGSSDISSDATVM